MTDRVERLARLAGIDLDAAERERLSRHLADLQNLIDALPDETAEPGNPHSVELELREDEPAAPLGLEVVEELLRARHDTWLELPPVREVES